VYEGRKGQEKETTPKKKKAKKKIVAGGKETQENIRSERSLIKSRSTKDVGEWKEK